MSVAVPTTCARETLPLVHLTPRPAGISGVPAIVQSPGSGLTASLPLGRPPPDLVELVSRASLGSPPRLRSPMGSYCPNPAAIFKAPPANLLPRSNLREDPELGEERLSNASGGGSSPLMYRRWGLDRGQRFCACAMRARNDPKSFNCHRSCLAD